MEKIRDKQPLLSDEELVKKIVAGETALFEILIRRYNQLLYRMARSYGLNHQDAQDMMQESHFAAYTQLKNFQMNAAYKTWLTRIHLHKCYHKTNYGALKYESPGSDEVIHHLRDEQADNTDNTESVIMNRELSRALEESLQKLPVSYRSVFLLRELEGFSVAETAGLLQITPINVKVRLNRSKAMLQKELEKFYSRAELFEFNQVYCDAIVLQVFARIANIKK